MIGASGLLGSALMRVLGDRATGTYFSRPQPGLHPLDARDGRAVRAAIAAHGPDAIFLTASDPSVDWCELHPVEARQRNVEPVRTVLAAAGPLPVVTYSSDYVFDGRSGPYAEEAERGPLSVYARLKVEIEDLVLAAGHTIVRTTTVFGIEPPPGKNFVLRLLASLRRGERVRVSSDQISTPTYADDAARASIQTAGSGGVWHVAGPTLMPRTELAALVAEVFGLDASAIDPVTTAQLGQPAARPLRGGLRTERYRQRFGSDPVRRPDVGLRAMRDLTV